jgi:hypothetical protein
MCLREPVQPLVPTDVANIKPKTLTDRHHRTDQVKPAALNSRALR